ncbi:MAG TPA: ABC-type transport auxiliary lipoprotein family protein [Allosphingosinicella sp.]|jgi:cholesterol transport system auxiliary component
MKIDRTLRSALFGLVFMLGGCGGLLGGGGSADLYRFGIQPVAETETALPDATRPISIFYAGANFEPAIDGDRILTVTGSQAAYVAGARWISPASELFDSATRRAFNRRMPSARMVRLVGAPPPDYAVGIEVRRFEADYVGGAAAPPEIVIETRVRLVRWSDRSLVAEWPVVSREMAQENRVATIVDAFDRGTNMVTARIADLTQEALGRSPAPGS